MLSTALRRELTVPHNRRASDKTITFVHTQDRRLRVHKRSLASIRQQEGQGLHKALSNVLKVKTKKAFTGDRNLPIESFEKLLTHIDSTIDPVVWLCNDSKPPTLPAPTPVEARPQRDYSNHAILKLEHLVESLSGKDHVRSARARFGLLQENHPHSKDFVKDLKVYFAPLEQATIAEWQKLSERQRLCEDAMGDPTYFEKLHELTTELGAEQQAHAQQYFALVNTSNPLASLAAENLIKLLLPDDVDWQFVKARKNLFDEIKSET